MIRGNITVPHQLELDPLSDDQRPRQQGNTTRADTRDVKQEDGASTSDEDGSLNTDGEESATGSHQRMQKSSDHTGASVPDPFEARSLRRWRGEQRSGLLGKPPPRAPPPHPPASVEEDIVGALLPLNTTASRVNAVAVQGGLLAMAYAILRPYVPEAMLCP